MFVAGAFTTDPGSNGVGTGINRLQVTLGRGDLGAKYECRVSSRAISSPLTASVEVDVNGECKHLNYFPTVSMMKFELMECVKSNLAQVK
jgi:hypothetical protein